MAEAPRILIVGCGNMGGAMLQGWLAGGVAPERVTVADPGLAEAPAGVTLVREVPHGTSDGTPFGVVLLGVKPQGLDTVAAQVARCIGPSTVLLSILAGVELATLAARFPVHGGLVRVMPNLSAAIGKSPLALAGLGVEAATRIAVTELLDPLGTPEWLADESLFDAVTALAGCGPAFVYRFIDALAAGAVALGLEPAQAQRLALATAEGSALLAGASPHAPGELARRVASPGGSTQAGLDVLDRDGALAGVVAAAMRAAEQRSAQMGREARGS